MPPAPQNKPGVDIIDSPGRFLVELSKVMPGVCQ